MGFTGDDAIRRRRPRPYLPEVHLLLRFSPGKLLKHAVKSERLISPDDNVRRLSLNRGAGEEQRSLDSLRARSHTFP